VVINTLDLRTKRLLLRPLSQEDASLLHNLWTSPGVRRYLWDNETILLERTIATIDTSERLFTDYHFGLWGAWARESHGLVGFGGLWYFRDPPALELLYGVGEETWGRGYAGEIARAVIDYGFGPLDMPEIRASTDAANQQSVRVLEKLGFTLTRRAEVAGLDTVFYELNRP
jgi:ribosomal-protein-alanine N-acetyltransferase